MTMRETTSTWLRGRIIMSPKPNIFSFDDLQIDAEGLYESDGETPTAEAYRHVEFFVIWNGAEDETFTAGMQYCQEILHWLCDQNEGEARADPDAEGWRIEVFHLVRQDGDSPFLVADHTD